MFADVRLVDFHLPTPPGLGFAFMIPIFYTCLTIIWTRLPCLELKMVLQLDNFPGPML
jgi:hypothetical protein